MNGLHCHPLLWFYRPLPSVSTSDEYVAMGSYSVSDTVSSVEKGHAAVHHVDVSPQPNTEVATSTATAATTEKEKGILSL